MRTLVIRVLIVTGITSLFSVVLAAAASDRAHEHACVLIGLGGFCGLIGTLICLSRLHALPELF